MNNTYVNTETTKESVNVNIDVHYNFVHIKLNIEYRKFEWVASLEKKIYTGTNIYDIFVVYFCWDIVELYNNFNKSISFVYCVNFLDSWLYVECTVIHII